MRKIYSLFIALLLTASMFAQAPEKMSYQAVIRDASDNLVTSQTVGMQISILQGSADGTPVYIETQTPITNVNGLVSIEIGAGTTSDDFSTIDWANGPYFIKTETDLAGGISYTITGTSQLLSVPYALHAKTAGSISGGITETDPTYTSSQAANITATDITNLSNLSGTNTGDQDLSSLATKTALGDSTAQVRSEIPDVSGFLTSYTETDPTYTNSQAANITATDITNLSNLSGTNTGDQDLSSLATKIALGDSTAQVRSEIPDVSGFLTSETDPTFTSSQAANITATDITNLSNLSGTNTGDQDLSSLATKTALGDSTAQVRSEIPDVSGFLTSETDPTFTGSEAANISATDITNLGNLSGTNTGDQDLSSLATKIALGDSTAQVRSEIPDVSGFLTSYTETDPIYGASVASGITGTDTTNWNNKLDSETDPVFTAWDKDYADLINAPVAADGSETKVTAGTNVTVTGAGTTASPYVVNTTGATPLAIGDSYGGGIIFWLDASGQHGLIAATADQNTGIKWYNGSYSTTGATLDAVYAGMSNTNKIIASQGAGSYAAQVCADYYVTVNNEYYDDWYLPSKHELNLLYLQKDVVGGFANGYYWSSTEDGTIYAAWRQNFESGSKYNFRKYYTYYVRAIRAF